MRKIEIVDPRPKIRGFVFYEEDCITKFGRLYELNITSKQAEVLEKTANGWMINNLGERYAKDLIEKCVKEREGKGKYYLLKYSEEYLDAKNISYDDNIYYEDCEDKLKFFTDTQDWVDFVEDYLCCIFQPKCYVFSHSANHKNLICWISNELIEKLTKK